MVQGSNWLVGEDQPLMSQVNVQTQSWEDTAIAHREVFEESLHVMGLAAIEIREALELRDEVAARIEHWNAQIEEFWATTTNRYITTPPEVVEMENNRYSLWRQLGDLFAGRTYIITKTETVDFEIALFTLAAAKPDGCTASFGSEQTSTQQLNFDIKVFGTGLGNSALVKASALSTFTAKSGEFKTVFLPARITLEYAITMENGKEVGEGPRYDASTLASTGALAVKTLEEGRIPPKGARRERYQLAKDTSGAISEYTYVYEEQRKLGLSIGVKAFDVDLGVKAETELTEKVTLSFGLKGGFEYKLHHTKEGDGIVWA